MAWIFQGLYSGFILAFPSSDRHGVMGFFLRLALDYSKVLDLGDQENSKGWGGYDFLWESLNMCVEIGKFLKGR